MKNTNQVVVIKLDEITPDNNETFIGIITKPLGNKRFSVLIIETNVEVQAKLAGSCRFRITTQDHVMVQIADNLSGNNAFILYKYNASELSALGVKKVVHNVDGTIDVNAEENEDGIDFDTI
jgi:translation initiation factor IF-1